MLKQQRGAAAIVLAMVCVVIVTSIITLLPRVVSDYAEDSRRYFVLTETLKIMEDLALVAQNARQLALANGNSDGTGNCPADTFEVIIDRTRNNASGGATTDEAFCFPDNTTGNNGACFLDPVERDDVNFCLSDEAVTAGLDGFGTLKWVPQRTKFESFVAKWKNKLRRSVKYIAKKIQPNPFAVAEPSYLPPDPAGVVNQSVQANVCPGPFPAEPTRDNDYCEACSLSNVTCIRLAICNPNASSGGCTEVPRDFFTQRIIIYNGGATL